MLTTTTTTTTLIEKGEMEMATATKNVAIKKTKNGAYVRKTETLWCYPGQHNFRRPAGIRGVKPKHCANHK
jgi:hypothetical protein